MYYYDQNRSERNSRKPAWVAFFAYCIICMLMLWLVKFNFVEDSVSAGNGILINFGTVEQASGLHDLPANDSQEVVADASSQASASEEELLTQEIEEAPEVEQARQPKPAPTPTPTPTPAPTTTAEATPSRTVDRRTLFNAGRTTGSTSTSEGTTSSGVGNQGVQTGVVEGSHQGAGSVCSMGFSLEGRSLAEVLPRPSANANECGTGGVGITVDGRGRVTEAIILARGTTTSNPALRQAARDAALKAKFDSSDNDVQRGTITYTFKLD